MQTAIASPKITIIQPQGSVNASNAQELQSQITTAIKQERQRIVLVDLEQVESFDSAGLMALVSGHRLAQSLERRLIVCCVPPSIKIIFELTQLDHVFSIFDSVSDVQSNNLLQDV